MHRYPWMGTRGMTRQVAGDADALRVGRLDAIPERPMRVMSGSTGRGARRRRRRAGGSSIIELALIAPVMVLLVFGVLDLARGYRMQIRLENAAREGAVLAQVQPNRVEGCADGQDIVSRVHAEDEGLTSMPIEVVVLTEDSFGAVVRSVSGCDGSHVTPGTRQRVEVSATFDVTTPIVERVVGDTITITGAAEFEVQGG